MKKIIVCGLLALSLAASTSAIGRMPRTGQVQEKQEYGVTAGVTKKLMEYSSTPVEVDQNTVVTVGIADDEITDCDDTTIYSTTMLNVRTAPNEESVVYKVVNPGTAFTKVGTVREWDVVKLEDGGKYYVDHEYTSTEKPVIPEPKPVEQKPVQQKPVQQAQQQPVQQHTSSAPSGAHLTKQSGVFYGPSGKETYYNLSMGRVVANMSKYGYSASDYWVRGDGVKMLGNYVMVAANLSVHPRGSLVQTSLGTGIVADTGGFCTNGSGVALDIATSW